MTKCSVFPLPGNEYYTEYRNALDQLHREGDLPAFEKSNGDKWWFINGKQHREGGLPAIDGADGNKSWYVNGVYHRDGGLPAIDWVIGFYGGLCYLKEWWLNGKRHRDDGLPAIDCGDGTREWWVNGLRHRDNGLPASERENGTKAWYVNGLRHREGGLPAVERENGTKTWWWLNGKLLTNDERLAYISFCQKMKEKKRIRAQKKIYFWWIQICYDMEHHSGCGIRMARRNLDVFESMMKT